MKNCAAALRFGSGKISVLVGARGVNNTLRIFGRGDSEYDGHQKGAFVTPEKVESAVYKAVRQAAEFSKTDIDRLFIGVPTDFCAFAVRDVSISFGKKHRVEQEDLNELYRMGDIYGKRSDYRVVTRAPIFFVTDDNRKSVDVLGVKTTRLAAKISYILADVAFLTFVERIVANMNISAVFIPSASAEMHYLFDTEERESGIIAASVGDIVSSVAIAKGDGILAARSFAQGGAYISRDLMEVLSTDFASAEALKKKVMLTLDVGEHETYDINDVPGKPLKSFPARAVNEVVADRLELIAKRIKAAIESTELDLPEYLPVYIFGGSIAYIRGAKDLMARTLNRPTVIVKPRQPMLDKPELSGILSLLNAAAALSED